MKKFRGLGFLIFLAVFAAATAVVMLLWNSVAVNIFNVPHINFWYSAGLLILSKFLLGGGGWMHRGHSHFHKHRARCKKGVRGYDTWSDCSDADHMREMHEKFHSMSGRERREHIRRHMASAFRSEEGFHGDCGHRHSGPETENGSGNGSGDSAGQKINND